MPIVNADSSSQQLYPDGTYLVVNNDETNPIYISQQRGVNLSDVPIPAQGSVQLTGPWYCSTLNKNVTVQVLVLPDGGEWTNPVGVSIALDTLGLAKDVTVAQTNTILGAPAQDTTLSQIPGQLQPTINSASVVQEGTAGSPVNIHTFGSNGRIWAVWLSFAIATNNAYVDSLGSVFAQVQTTSGLKLGTVELAISDPSQTANGQSELPLFNPVPINSGDSVQLSINGGSAIIDATLRASAGILYSTP